MLWVLFLFVTSTFAQQYSLTVKEHGVDIDLGQTIYRLYVDMVNGDDFLHSVYGDENNPLSIATSDRFYNDVSGSTVAPGINPALFVFFPTSEADSWVTIGIESQNNGDEVFISTVEDTNQPWVDAFESGSGIDGRDVVINTAVGGAWYVLNGAPNGLPDSDGRVLIMQLTTSGTISGTVNVLILQHGDGDTEIRKTFSFDGTGTFFDADDSVTDGDSVTDDYDCEAERTAWETDCACMNQDQDCVSRQQIWHEKCPCI